MQDLEDKIWYRILKVLYIAAYIIFIGFLLILLSATGFAELGNLLMIGAVGVVIIELLKRGAIYIAVGKNK